MNADQLAAFATVVEKNSFTRAGAKLGVSQPTVTARIKALEHELDCQLLIRSASAIEMTDAGRELLPIAMQILQLLAAAEAIGHPDQEVAGTRVTLGCSGLIAATRLLPFIEFIYHRYPTLDLQVRDVAPDRMEDELKQGRLDFAVVLDVERERPDLCSLRLCDEPLVALSSPEVQHDQLSHGDGTPGLTWIRCEEASEWQSEVQRRIADATPAEVGTRTISLASVDTVKRTVQNGVGFTVLPAAAAADELRHGTLVRPRWQPEVATSLFALWRPHSGDTPTMGHAVLSDLAKMFGVHLPRVRRDGETV